MAAPSLAEDYFDLFRHLSSIPTSVQLISGEITATTCLSPDGYVVKGPLKTKAAVVPTVPAPESIQTAGILLGRGAKLTRDQ